MDDERKMQGRVKSFNIFIKQPRYHLLYDKQKDGQISNPLASDKEEPWKYGT